ncbi:MAG: dephospho-CoA kinase [Eubacteriales bacterium]|nr:dephospho-CoA kinase [Eubacteriales bacterium]
MFIIGITGGIGCGKTTVANLCRQAGLNVIDADEISRQATAPDGLAIEPIVTAFGRSVLDAKGGLDRAKMARQVFADRKALDQLSQIIHREVIAEMQRQIEKLKEKKVKAAVLDVPIPVKQGFLDSVNQVWVLWAEEEVRISRLLGRGMAEDDARRRIAMQMTRDEYQAIADHLIDNSGDYASLVQTVEGLFRDELGSRGIRYHSLTKAATGDEREFNPA